MDPLAWPVLVSVFVIGAATGWLACITLLYRHWCGRNPEEGTDHD
jgi:hypothetical protein